MSGDSLGELKVDVSVDIDVAAAKAAQQQIAGDAVATQTAAANQVESIWQKALRAKAAASESRQVQAGASLAASGHNIEGMSGDNLLAQAAHVAAQQKAAADTKKANEDAAKKSADAWERAAAEAAKAQADAAKKTKEEWLGAARSVQTAIVGAFAVAGAAVVAFGQHMLESGLAIDRQARSLGMSTDAVQRWGYTAEQAGVESQAVGEALGGFAQRASQAAEAGGDAARNFTDLGVTLTDQNDQLTPLNDMLLQAADGLMRMGPGADQTAAAMQLFGEKGRLLLPVLARGRAGVEELGAEFGALGGGLDEGTIQQMVELDRELNRVKVALLGAVMPSVREMIDGAKRLADRIRPLVAGFQEFSAKSHVVRAALIALGATAAGVGIAMAVAFGPVVITFAAIVAGALLAGLAIDDLWTTLEGGDSVLKQTLEGLLGVGGAATAIEGLRAVFMGLGAAVERVLILLGLVDPAEQAANATAAAQRAITNAQVMLETPEQRQARVASGASAGSNALAAAQYSTTQAGSGARLAATPGALFRVDPGAAANGTVGINNRTQVQINGLVDPTVLANIVKSHVNDALDSANAKALEGVTKGGRRT
jgi:hypothetical protein